MVVPAAFVERDERDARLDQPAGQQEPLAERVAAVGVADASGSPWMSNAFWASGEDIRS